MKIQKTILHIAIAALFLWLPFHAFAISIFVDFPEAFVRVNNTALLKVSVKTEGKEINAVDGKIFFSDPDGIVSITTGGSVFSLWPKKPSLEGSVISFTGGTPSGVYGDSLRLFTIAIKPTSTNPIKITFEDVTAYLNDGNGTKISVSAPFLEIPVLQAGDTEDELASLVESDTNKPSPFSIDLGRDPALFGGRYFISFYATDNESGINRYEVEEDGFSIVQSDSPYVLQNQNLSGVVEVRAIDNAGNARVQSLELKPTMHWFKIVSIIILIIIVFLLVYFVVRKIFRKK
ncbi:MAG: hypothetical protein AAB534_03495 [Patescibacteria group bacterium]